MRDACIHYWKNSTCFQSNEVEENDDRLPFVSTENFNHLKFAHFSASNAPSTNLSCVPHIGILFGHTQLKLTEQNKNGHRSVFASFAHTKSKLMQKMGSRPKKKKRKTTTHEISQIWPDIFFVFHQNAYLFEFILKINSRIYKQFGRLYLICFHYCNLKVKKN